MVAPDALAGVGVPYWLAGAYATPDGLARALAGGATGVQAGTIFALSRESGMADELKHRLSERVTAGTVAVRTDGRASPTGFPFKVADIEGTLSDHDVYASRNRLCDLGVLRAAYRKADGTVGYRCPAEPVEVYVDRRGGRIDNTTGRCCLCNALLATAGLPQQRPDGYTEPAIVTAGTDFTGARHLLAGVVDGDTYTAADAVAYLLGD